VLKDNRLLAGLGIGLILGAILLQLMNLAVSGVGQNALTGDSAISEKEYTLEELRDIADQLDHYIIEKSAVVYTQKELDDAVLQAVEEASVSETPEEKPVDSKVTSYRFTIKAGMVTDEVTDLLMDIGLINDAESFKKELSDRNLNNRIQVGTFEFNEKPSLTELINKITTVS
jgi:hypothetical protein